LKDKIERLIDLIIVTETRIVGFTIYSSSAHMSLHLARLLKQRKPEIQIIFGGPHASRHLAGHSLIKNDFVDAVVQGEGELTLIDIISRYKDTGSFTDCPGIIIRKDGEAVDNVDRDVIKDLNQVPAPDFSDYAFELYRTPSRLPIISSRGCPNRCIFCNERPFWRSYRGRSANTIFEEIKAQVVRYPFINFLDFQDSLVNGLIKELDHLADLIIQSGLNIKWAGQAAIRKEMTPELLMKLKRSGCVCLAYGLETPSESLMLKIGKRLSAGADVNAIAEAHGRTGLSATYNFMFGLPGESETDAFESHEFLRRNKKYSIAVNPSSGFCGFAPGTLVHEDPDRYGVDLIKGSMFWESRDGTNTYITRLKRFEDFCRLVQELGISTTYPSTVLLDRNRSLGHYYRQAGQNAKAIWYFKSWLDERPEDNHVRTILLEMLPNADELDVKSHREKRVSVETFGTWKLKNHTDENWLNGVARQWAAAFFIDFSNYALNEFSAGRSIRFSDGSIRVILKNQENAGCLIVYVDGPPLDGGHVGYPNTIAVTEMAK
jgi:radical SAM superfamily enzyme YgiQ (UPF0313 family)